MKVTRKICPICREEQVSRRDVKNVHEYEENITYEKCPKHKNAKDTPEEKLLRAIYGE